MSDSNYNKIISTINSVSRDYTYSPEPNNLICIDTLNNRIGINTLDPQESLHISGGNIKVNTIIAENIFYENIYASQASSGVVGGSAISVSSVIATNSITSPLLIATNIRATNNIDASSIVVTNILDISRGRIRANNIDISSNLNPLVPNKGTLGLSDRRWGNAYINDISAISIDISTNLNPLVPNKGTIGLPNKAWGNAYINDISVSSIDISVNLNPLVPNKGTIGLSNKQWGNAYINDVSVASIDISVNLNPLVPNKGSIGLPNKPWGNAYIKDISATNIEPLSNNTSNLGSMINKWNNIYTNDLIVTALSSNTITSVVNGLTSVVNGLIPRITTLEARSNVYKIEYLRWYNSYTMNGQGGFDGFAMNTAGGDAPATFVKIANTKIAIKTSFRYTCAGFNGDYLLSKLSIYQGTNLILEGSFVEQLWTGANGGGTRSGTLTDCSVFMDTSSHIAMSGTLIVKLEISKAGLDDPLQLGPGYFEVIHLYN